MGDVVLVYDDTPQVACKMAVVEELIKGNDGLVRAANIITTGGKTNRPITRLVPLEVSSSSVDTIQYTSQTRSLTSTATTSEGLSTEFTDQGGHTQWEAARIGRARVANGYKSYRPP